MVTYLVIKAARSDNAHTHDTSFYMFCILGAGNITTGCQYPTDISGSGFSGFLFGFLVVRFSVSFLRPSEAFSQVSFFYLFDLSIGLPTL